MNIDHRIATAKEIKQPDQVIYLPLKSVDKSLLGEAQNLIAGLNVEQTKNGPRIVMHKDDPRIIGSGQHAVVLQLPNSNSVIKLVGIQRQEDLIYCKGEHVFQAAVEIPIELMVEALREVFKDKDVFIPDHLEQTSTCMMTSLNGDKHEMTYTFHVCPDLTENGRYELHEASDFDFRSINNGSELFKTFCDAWETLCNLPSGQYTVSYNTHRFSEGMLPDKATELPIAMQRVFFVVVDPLTNHGRLVAGDLDHIGIVNNKSLFAYLSQLSDE